MAAGKEIRGKIKSVENTKKITKAMEMVAASGLGPEEFWSGSGAPLADAGLTADSPEVVAVAEGPAQFRRGAGPGTL